MNRPSYPKRALSGWQVRWGAADFELDRADRRLATPFNMVILARSKAHQAHTVAVPEELLSHVNTVTGEAP